MHRGRLAVAAGLALTAIAGVIWLDAALAGDPLPVPPTVAPTLPIDASSPLAQAVLGGTHVRIEGPRGPIHVWIPASYHADTGATVLYVHGYYDTADTAWSAHQLPEQFAMSGLDAMFIVPEAPTSNRSTINYPDLGEVLRLVEDKTGLPRGAGKTIAMAHSGGFRTLETWLDEPLLDQLVMIDAMYGDEDKIIAWYRASERRRLIMVGEDTVLGTETVLQKQPEAVVLDRFPPTYEMLPVEARTARLVYVRAQFGHMQLVNEGIAIPTVLRLLNVARLGDAPWKLPLGSLPALPDAAIEDGPT